MTKVSIKVLSKTLKGITLPSVTLKALAKFKYLSSSFLTPSTGSILSPTLTPMSCIVFINSLGLGNNSLLKLKPVRYKL